MKRYKLTIELVVDVRVPKDVGRLQGYAEWVADEATFDFGMAHVHDCTHTIEEES